MMPGLLLSALLLASAQEPAPPTAIEDTRPNILILFADDLGRYASAYSRPDQPSVNDAIQTPNFDWIASQGMVATNAFVSAPSCTPSRAALVSGRHFFRNGSGAQLHSPWHSDDPDPWDEVQGYGKRLAAAGYHVGLTYKDHVPDKQFGKSYQPAGRRVNGYSQFVSKQEDIEAAKQQLDDEARRNFRAFLDAREPGQPFLYSFHPTNPHRKWIRGSGKALWGIDPDELEGKMPSFLPDVPVIREDFADYLGEAMAFDRCCGVLIDELRKTGELDQTLILISGDHGAPGFPRGKTSVYDFGARVLFAARWPERIQAGQVVDTPISLIDVAPTLLEAAGVPAVEGMNGQSLLPALAKAEHDKLRGSALIGREIHYWKAREGLLPYPTRAIRVQDYLYIVNFKPERGPNGDVLRDLDGLSFEQLANQTGLTYPDLDACPTKAWMIQNRDDERYQWHWQLGFGHRPAEELYYLPEDPHQVRNLAEDPKFAEAKASLREQLFAELERWNDPRLDGDCFDRFPYLVK